MPFVALIVNHVHQSSGKEILLRTLESFKLLLRNMFDDYNIVFRARESPSALKLATVVPLLPHSDKI